MLTFLPNRVLRPVSLILAAVVLGLSLVCTNGEERINVVTVYAAASLTDAFRDIAEQFELANPGVEVKLNFAGSQRLRSQLELGAKADVFASADERQMRLAKEAGLLSGEAQYFASTPMAVIVFEGSGISSLDDLGTPGRKIVLAHGNVPAGEYSRQLLERLSTEDTGLGADYAKRVLANIVSEETSVKFAEQKVVLGQADASIVYSPGARTATADGPVRELPLPPQADAVRASYPIAALESSSSPEWGNSFIRYVLSPDGQSILSSYGFAGP